MRTSAKLITALSVAALVGVAGSAFTASNTVPAEGVSGYGETEASGVTITSITNNLLPADNSRLASVIFASSTDLTADDDAFMTLKNDATVFPTTNECITDAATDTITCTITGVYPLLSAFDTTGITVLGSTVIP